MFPGEKCDEFFVCTRSGVGGAMSSNCADGLHFDAAKKVCNWPQEAGCSSNTAYTNDVMTSPSLCSSLGDGLFKDPVDCSRYTKLK